MATRSPNRSHQSLLEVKGLVKAFKGRRVVDGVCFHVEAGEVVGLLGPNGAGKTTTFRMTVGLEVPDQGKIWLKGKDCTKQPMYIRARTGMGYLPQEPSVFRRMTVRDNLLAVLEAMPYSRKERRRRADELLDELDILSLSGNMADTLSGGERRRLEISRALATDPAALLLDEPFAGVAPIAVQEIQEIIAQLRDRNIGILITDHNVRETLQSTDRAYVISRGIIIKKGSAEELVSDPQVREVYLGHSFDAPIQGVTAEEEMELMEEDFSSSGAEE